MSYLGPVRFDVVGDRAKAAKYFGIARKFIGDLIAVGGGVMHNRMRRNLEDGTVIEVQIAGKIVSAVINVTGVGIDAENDVLMYVSSSGGELQVLNLTKKKRSTFFTGLGSLLAQQTTKGGALLYMTGSAGVVARLDMKKVEGFAKTYAVKTPDSNDYNTWGNFVGAATIVDGVAARVYKIELSPDGENLLVAFEGSGVADNFGVVIKEGVGGTLLVEAKTLDLKKIFRMSDQPAPFAWAPNSEKFYVSTVKATDNGDIQASQDLRDLITSTSDYVSVFNKDGALLGSRLLKTWAFEPTGGFFRSVKRVVVSRDNKVVYVSVEGGVFWTDTGSYIYALDATDNTLPILEAYTLPDDSKHLSLSVTPGGGRLTLLRQLGADPATVMEFDISNGGLELLSNTASLNFNTPTQTGLNKPEVLRAAPHSSIPGDATLRFLHSKNGAVSVMYAYNDFAKPPISEYDISEFNTFAPYCLFRKTTVQKVAPK